VNGGWNDDSLGKLGNYSESSMLKFERRWRQFGLEFRLVNTPQSTFTNVRVWTGRFGQGKCFLASHWNEANVTTLFLITHPYGHSILRNSSEQAT